MKLPIARQTIKQASILIAVISISSQGFGIVREAIIANFLGTSAEYDILLVSMVIPLMVANIIFMAIPSAGIPFLQQARSNSNSGYDKASSSFVKTNGIITLTISIITFIALPLFKGILAHGLSGDQIERFITYGRIFCLAIPIRGYEAIYRSLLQQKRNFLFPAFAVIGFNVFTIAILLIAFPALGTPGFILAWLAGMSVQCMIVIIPAYILLRRGIKDESGKLFAASRYIRYLSIIFIVESFGLLRDPFDRFLASSYLESGYVSANYYAIVISSVPIKVIIYALGTAIFPSLSEKMENDQKDAAGKLYHKVITICLIVIVPISVYFYLYSGDIVRILFERGKFGNESSLITAEVLRFYVFAMIFQSIFFIQMRVIYSLKLWKFMIFALLVAFSAKVLIGLIFIERSWALALGGGAVAMFIIIYLLLESYLNITIGLKYDRDQIIVLLKGLLMVSISAALMLVFRGVFSELVAINRILEMILVAVAGFGSLAIMEYRLKISNIFKTA